VLLARLTLLALAVFASPVDDWKRISPELELQFPADHGAHPDYRIEWWYITGQLESEAGRRFGYQFTIFRRGMAMGEGTTAESPLRARQVLAGHLAITDVENGRTLFAERLRRAGSVLAEASSTDLALVLDDWSLDRGADDRLELSAGDLAAEIGMELTLVPAKPLVFHGEDGYSQKGADPGNATAYFSWTRLATTGTLRIGGTELAVTGESWFDHEYGSSVLEEGVVGWDWFGLQLDDGRDLMMFMLRTEDGGYSAASAGTLVDTDGSTRSLGSEDFKIEGRGEWTSPHSGARYPARWTLTVPSEDLRLEVTPLVADCELGTAQTTGVAYWEGPVVLTGSRGGRGYAELTGYAGSMEGRL